MAGKHIFSKGFIVILSLVLVVASLNLISTQALAQGGSRQYTDEERRAIYTRILERAAIQQEIENRKIFTTRPVPVRFVSNTSDPYTFETVNKLNAYVQNGDSAWAKGAGGANEYIKVSVRMSSHKKGFVYETIELKLVWEYETPSLYPRQKTIERMDFEIKKYPLMDDSAVKEITEVTDIIIQKILNDG